MKCRGIGFNTMLICAPPPQLDKSIENIMNNTKFPRYLRLKNYCLHFMHFKTAPQLMRLLRYIFFCLLSGRLPHRTELHIQETKELQKLTD